jgi:CBS domain-containing protein
MYVAAILKVKGRNVVTTTADKSLLDVTKLLEQHDIGCVVIEGGDGQVAGIVSERDLVVSCRESGLSITYRKDALAPMLIAVDGIDRSSEPSKVKFWQAWKAAYHKARTLGWLSG